MNRAEALRDLSRDHHHALVLARRAKLADASTAAPIWEDVDARLRTELEPHFQIEERLLAPALSAIGEGVLVQRLLDDHAALRALVASRQRGVEELVRFGRRLEEHVRFEEHELFEVAQRSLSDAVLAEVAAASRGRRRN
jgi:hemerythrin-like domain-containing protein